MKLVISIDVEEEGLFSGRYSRTPPGVKNVSALDRLEFIPREFGFPLTLLLSYQVGINAAARPVIQQWQQGHGAEIGAHLHHWNTPPFGHETEPEPLASRELPSSRLQAKLENLVTTIGRNFDCTPRSFRMGRFDWWPFILDLLPGVGLRFDSSMVPLAHYVGRVDQYRTPTDPFRLLAGQPRQPLVEIPLTMIPVMPRLARVVYRIAKKMAPAPGGEAAGIIQTLRRGRHSSDVVPAAVHASGGSFTPPPGRPGAEHVFTFLGTPPRGDAPLPG